MSTPRQDDIVTIVFTGKLDNGEIFTQIAESDPLKIKIGNHDLPPTVEQMLLTMQVGESRKVRVPPEEGYGPRQKNLLQVIESQEMVDRLKPLPGMVISLKAEYDGSDGKVPATIIEVDGPRITVDYNHPLAGHHLTYELHLLAIEHVQ